MQFKVLLTIIICALGYFVDVFDMQLFAILRVPSLTELGISSDRITTVGGYILNTQMAGMVSGAFLWGWLGDKFGRLKALYGSILIYSLGTFACGFIHDTVTYGLLRYVSGFGLAGETGIAITLVAELMPKEKRIWGIMTMAAFGILGPTTAAIISQFMEWRTTYIFAGCMGLALFALRVGLGEPALYKKIAGINVPLGSWKILLQPQQRKTFLYCILMGLPLSYCWYILNFYSAEFSRVILDKGEVFNQKTCLMIFYLGAGAGTLLCGTLSQLWHNQKRAITAILILGFITSAIYLTTGQFIPYKTHEFYIVYLILGIAAGGWSIFVSLTAEHFGTNVRATVTTTMVNLLRGFSIPMIFAFQTLKEFMTITNAAAIIGFILYCTAFWAIRQLRETHGVDLDYIEI